MTDRIVYISDLLGQASEHGYLLIDEANLPTEFFTLRSGLAGDIFQKFVNYQMALAVLVKDPSVYGDRVVELVREHQRHPLVRFFSDADSAKTWLSRFN
ncbi:DUF4180 domain-containing protein [Saccharospirillum mangrovi]|uniref:DUF4180 domain-containing protein n=1 Tax=Saccharospirillum mangrovi TaxID=2161747 RepID=UPI0018E4FF4C|nr:DUF4180 domain-containing protein [Saccharospirillum mangrovi]